MIPLQNSLNKKFQVKIFGRDGLTFKETINPGIISSDISFSSKINGGQGELVLNLDVPFDNFSSNIAFMNIVHVNEYDDNRIDPLRIYTGFISEIRPFVRGANQGVSISCLGLVSLLSFDYYADADFTVSHTTDDPATP